MLSGKPAQEKHEKKNGTQATQHYATKPSLGNSNDKKSSAANQI